MRPLQPAQSVEALHLLTGGANLSPSDTVAGISDAPATF